MERKEGTDDLLRFLPSLHFKIFRKTWHLQVLYNMGIKKTCDWLTKSYHLNKLEQGY